jgi:hypothetical protein
MTFDSFINPLEKRGTYSAIKFSKESVETLINKINDLQIPNPIDKEDIHCTLIYSRKYLPYYEATTPMKFEFPISCGDLDLFGENRNILVLKLNSKILTFRHNEIMSDYSGVYDYDEYIPHITLSYDVGNFDISSIKAAFKNIKLKSQIEYSEPLDLSDK